MQQTLDECFTSVQRMRSVVVAFIMAFLRPDVLQIACYHWQDSKQCERFAWKERCFAWLRQKGDASFSNGKMSCSTARRWLSSQTRLLKLAINQQATCKLLPVLRLEAQAFLLMEVWHHRDEHAPCTSSFMTRTIPFASVPNSPVALSDMHTYKCVPCSVVS